MVAFSCRATSLVIKTAARYYFLMTSKTIFYTFKDKLHLHTLSLCYYILTWPCLFLFFFSFRAGLEHATWYSFLSKEEMIYGENWKTHVNKTSLWKYNDYYYYYSWFKETHFNWRCVDAFNLKITSVCTRLDYPNIKITGKNIWIILLA